MPAQSKERSSTSRNATSVPPNPVMEAPSRTKRAEAYEERISGLLNYAMRGLAQNPSTAADAAAIIHHGPIVASKWGDLADHDERVRKAIDFITSGTENPYVAVALTTLPLLAQILRNHETPQSESLASARLELRVPFTKKSFKIPRWRFRIRAPFFRSMTVDPRELTHYIFTQDEIVTALAASGVQVSLPSNWNGKVTV